MSATVEGPPVVVGEYDEGALDLLDPCALPGGSDFEGKVQLTVVDDTVTGTLRLSEAVDCLGFNYVPYPGYAEFDGAFGGEQFLLTVTRLEGGVNAWACLSQDAPAISVITPDSASAQWTAALPPDSSFDCRISLKRDQPQSAG